MGLHTGSGITSGTSTCMKCCQQPGSALRHSIAAARAIRRALPRGGDSMCRWRTRSQCWRHLTRSGSDCGVTAKVAGSARWLPRLPTESLFLVLIASMGVTPAEQMLYAIGEQMRRGGINHAVVTRALALRQMFEDWVHGRAPERQAKLLAELRSAADEPWWPRAFLLSRLLNEEERRSWIEEMDFDPRPAFASVRVPTLLFYGEDDAWTPVEPSIEAWRQAHGDEAEIVVVPDATHELTLPGGILAPAYSRRLVDWLRLRASDV